MRPQHVARAFGIAEPPLFIDKRRGVGLGHPTESPFFADIFVPSSYRLGIDPPCLPVKVSEPRLERGIDNW